MAAPIDRTNRDPDLEAFPFPFPFPIFAGNGHGKGKGNGSTLGLRRRRVFHAIKDLTSTSLRPLLAPAGRKATTQAAKSIAPVNCTCLQYSAGRRVHPAFEIVSRPGTIFSNCLMIACILAGA